MNSSDVDSEGMENANITENSLPSDSSSHPQTQKNCATSIGSVVVSAYGIGTIIDFRESDGIFCIELDDIGTLFAVESSFLEIKCLDVMCPPKRSMELNEAYEAFEKMRMLNFEVECNEAGIIFSDESQYHCASCVLEKGPTAPISPPRFHLINRFARGDSRPLKKQAKHHFFRKLMNDHRKKKANPCLLCGSPCCSYHSSRSFRRENITVCNQCVTLFELNEEVGDFDGKELDHMVDLYDRALLLLKYMSQFIPQIADSLEANTQTHNQVTLGGSSAGVVSGVLGVAAAATILTPAGPPLLIASLVFGGSATAVQTSSHMVKYYSEPNQLADRFMALYGMVKSVLRKLDGIRDKVLVPYIYTVIPDSEKSRKGLLEDTKDTAATLGVRVGANAVTGLARLSSSFAMDAVESGASSARFFSRAGANLAKTAQFARFAGGALSAATLLIEACEMTKTIEQIRAGSPCDKANTIRKIQTEILVLPQTSTVDMMCQCYLRVINMKEKEQEDTPVENGNDWELVEEVVKSLEAQQEDKSRFRRSSKRSKWVDDDDERQPTLFQRIQMYKEREAREQAEISLVL